MDKQISLYLCIQTHTLIYIETFVGTIYIGINTNIDKYE